MFIMPFYPQHDRYQDAGDKQSYPPAFIEFDHCDRDEDKSRQPETNAAYGKFPAPVIESLPVIPPITHHTQLGEQESYEDVYTIKDDEQNHGTAGSQHHHERPDPHNKDAVLSEERRVGKEGRSRWS